MPIDSQPVKNTLSLGNVAYAARTLLFSREDLQHYQLPIGGGGGCRSNFAAASHARGILAASATQTLASPKSADLLHIKASLHTRFNPITSFVTCQFTNRCTVGLPS